MGHQYHKGHRKVYGASLLRVNESIYVFGRYYLAQISSFYVDVFEWAIHINYRYNSSLMYVRDYR